MHPPHLRRDFASIQFHRSHRRHTIDVSNHRRGTSRRPTERTHTNWHSLVFYGELADIPATFDKGDNIFVEGTLQTRQFTPKDGSTRTVYEVVARNVHQIMKSRAAKEPPADNDPQTQHSTTEPGVPAEVEANAEVWPS